MDKDRKIQMLLDMQEHPEQYSEQALEDMLNDAESQELMEATAGLKRAMKHEAFSMSGQDIDAEWHDFATAHFAKQEPPRNWLKMVATFVGILIVTGIAFATVHIISNYVESKDDAPRKDEQTVNSQSTDDGTNKTDTLAKAPVVFDNVTLDSIAKEIAFYHHIAVDMQNEQAKELRFYFVWKQEDSLAVVVEKLNMFERVNLAIEDGKLTIR